VTISTNKLGRLEMVDLREVWGSESTDFTPWLAKDENIALLGDTIGLDLEVESREKQVGPFRADILCKETTTDNWVLIENQLERTDHNHLGQLLTYAAGLKAVTIVWIAERFTEEHRATLDWLNEITDERFDFFGLEIELWKIGDSPIAPKFNVVCSPNDWSKAVSGAAEGGISETKLLQQDYWAALRKLLLERKRVVRPQRPPAAHWTNFAIGRSHFGMTATVNTQKRFIQVAVSCYGDEAKAHFHLLQQQKDEIEQEAGCSFDWEELPNRKESRISIRNSDVDPADRDNWPAQRIDLAHAAGRTSSFRDVPPAHCGSDFGRGQRSAALAGRPPDFAGGGHAVPVVGTGFDPAADLPVRAAADVPAVGPGAHFDCGRRGRGQDDRGPADRP